MATTPTISEAIIRQHADAESFRRGRQYYQDGAVLELTLRGMILQAEVEGSQYDPYRVRVAFDAGGVTEATCTCPYDWGGWCKHIIATLLAYVHAPAEIEPRPALPDLLAGLNRDQLQALVLELAERDPAAADLVEARVAMLAAAPPTEAAATPAAAPRRRAPIDPQPVRRQMRDVMRPPRHGYEYAYGRTVLAEAEEILKQPLTFIAGGDGANAIRLLEPITDEYVEHFEDMIEFDDEGEMTSFIPPLADAWAEALLSADLTADEREGWAARLDEWAAGVADYAGGDEFDMARSVAEEGWAHPALRRVLSGDADDADPWDGEPPAYMEPLAPIWLRVLERQGRIEEYLRLARATGEAARYTVMLTRLGRIEEAIAAGRRLLTTAPDALLLAQALRERGEVDAAVQVAEHGLGLDEPRAPLAAWLADLAEGLGRRELALRAGEVAFRSEPSLNAYLKVGALAGEHWPALRAELLDFLRACSSAWQVNQAAVEIFLHERLVDDAIRAVRHDYSYDLLRQVMDAAIGSRNDWVIQNATKQAEIIIDAGKASHYDEAIGWLRRARDAYRSAGRQADWQGYRAALQEAHGRKYKLMGLMKAL
jgi:uncharacterized Zn finger protein